MKKEPPAAGPALPYFDVLLNLLRQENSALQRAFGRHVHWGYWPDPSRAEATADDFARAAEALSLQLSEAAKLADGQRVLDTGCGLGGTLASIDGRHNDMELLGLNIDRRQLLYARSQFQATWRNPVRLTQANACQLPFADGSLDAVLAVECIFHFPSRRDFFLEARRVLKPGGRLALSDFVPVGTLRPLTSLIARWPVSIGFYGRCDFTYTLNDYRRLARETGFEISEERDITENTLPTYDFLRTLRPSIGLRKPAAVLETLFAECTSRLGALRYLILSFQKPASAPLLNEQ